MKKLACSLAILWDFISGTKGAQQPYQLVSLLWQLFFLCGKLITSSSLCYQICGNWFHCLPACSCSHLLCTSCSCSSRPVHKVWWDVRDVLQPWRPYFGGQRPCPGAAPSAWESQELDVLLLSIYSLLLRHFSLACAVALLLVGGWVWTLVVVMSGGVNALGWCPWAFMNLLRHLVPASGRLSSRMLNASF